MHFHCPVLLFFLSVRLWEVSVVNRQSLMEPFVWLTSKMTQPPSKHIYVRLGRYVRKRTPTLTNLWCTVLMYNWKRISIVSFLSQTDRAFHFQWAESRSTRHQRQKTSEMGHSLEIICHLKHQINVLR